MFTEEHITQEDLQSFAESTVDSETDARVRNHLASGCQNCNAYLADVSRIVVALRAYHALALPSAVRQQAHALFDRFERSRPLRNRKFATVVFDSRLQIAHPGSRRHEVASFELLCEAQDVSIDVVCEREGGGWHLAGQVFSEDLPLSGWSLAMTGPQEKAGMELDALNQFRFSSLAPGVYQLCLRRATLEIVIPEIALPGP